MSFRIFGETLSKLRKKSGMTQQELAEILDFSNKTISKWETSETLPEITVLLQLAEIFGVSVDYLLCGERKSIVFAGTLLADMSKDVNCYPEVGKLARITSTRQSVGGCVASTAINLAKIDSSIPISAYGCVGDDETGHFILSKMKSYNINTNSVTVLPGIHTDTADVFNLPDGSRVFFNSSSAGALFGPEHIDLEDLQCQILHVGYALLLDKFEAPDSTYGTVMARFLNTVRTKGIKTSLDIASPSEADWKKRVLPTFKYVDYLICNEVECCSCFDVSPRNDDGTLNLFSIKSAMQKALSAGINEKVIIHTKEAAFLMNKNGSFFFTTSIDVPKENIKGSAGPGDAFCAAALYAIYNDMTDQELLEFASGAAAMSLFSKNAIDGMRDKKEILKFIKGSRRKQVKGINI